MKDLLIYDLKVVALIAVFYLLYRLLLHRSTLHRLNRMVLLGSLGLSLALPLCVITIHKTIDVSVENTVAAMPSPAFDGALVPAAVVDSPAATDMNAVQKVADNAVSEHASIPWLMVFSVIFLCGAAFMLIRLAWSLISVLHIIRGGRQVAVQDGCSILVTERKISTFSFGRIIVIPRSDWESKHDAMLCHEKAHARLHHSIDNIAVELVKSFQWFNPAIWFLASDLREVHEYEADDAVIQGGVDANEYQHLLIGKAMLDTGYSVANGFNRSSLSSRIAMMSQPKTPAGRGARALYMIPVICLALFAGHKTVYAANPVITADENLQSVIVQPEIGRTETEQSEIGHPVLEQLQVESENNTTVPQNSEIVPLNGNNSVAEKTDTLSSRLTESNGVTVGPDGSRNIVTVNKDANGNPSRKLERIEKDHYAKNSQYRWVDGEWQLYHIDENETDDNGNTVMSNFEDLQMDGTWNRMRTEYASEYDADGNRTQVITSDMTNNVFRQTKSVYSGFVQKDKPTTESTYKMVNGEWVEDLMYRMTYADDGTVLSRESMKRSEDGTYVPLNSRGAPDPMDLRGSFEVGNGARPTGPMSNGANSDELVYKVPQGIAIGEFLRTIPEIEVDDNFNVTMNGEKVSWGYVNNEVRILPNHPNHFEISFYAPKTNPKADSLALSRGAVFDEDGNMTLDGGIVSGIQIHGDRLVGLEVREKESNPEDYEVTQLSDDMRNLILSAPGVKIDENGVISIDGINISRVVVDDEEIYSRTKRDDVDK